MFSKQPCLFFIFMLLVTSVFGEDIKEKSYSLTGTRVFTTRLSTTAIYLKFQKQVFGDYTLLNSPIYIGCGYKHIMYKDGVGGLLSPRIYWYDESVTEDHTITGDLILDLFFTKIASSIYFGLDIPLYNAKEFSGLVVGFDLRAWNILVVDLEHTFFAKDVKHTHVIREFGVGINIPF